MRHPAEGLRSQGGSRGGPGVHYTSPFALGGGGRVCAATPCAQRSSSTSPGRTTAAGRRAPASPCRGCCAIPTGVDTHKGGLGGGGAQGCVTRHLLPWRWARIRAAAPCSSAQLQHLSGQDHLRVVPSGLNEPQFPVFSRETWAHDLARLENREIAGLLERGAGLRPDFHGADRKRAFRQEMDGRAADRQLQGPDQ
jgi:hypothetical protein